MIPEEIDQQALVEELKTLLPGGPVGYLRGKAMMRDALVDRKRISQMEAEDLIDTLESNGYLHFLGDPSQRSVADSPWEINPHDEN
ncbi:MAG: hypothetical protein M3Y59_22905 [Myxococcota bacterium]|nr:hypothetical protein [Myxococcota bacterium]